MEGVGESCCRCVPPGEWVWGAAEEFQGEDDGRESEVAAPSPGGWGRHWLPQPQGEGSLGCGSWARKGPSGWGWGPLRLGLSLCPPSPAAPASLPHHPSSPYSAGTGELLLLQHTHVFHPVGGFSRSYHNASLTLSPQVSLSVAPFLGAPRRLRLSHGHPGHRGRDLPSEQGRL